MQHQLTETTFKDAVRTYIELHDELTESAKQMRELRRKKEDLGAAVLKFMRDNKIDEFQVADGTLKRRNGKRTEGLKKEYILDSLKAALADETKAQAVFTQMNSHRNVTECESLCRLRQSQSNS